MGNKAEAILPINAHYVVEYCLLCDKTIRTSEYPHQMRGVCCDDCKALWKKIKEGNR
jgi:hypothetical protein